MNEHENKLGGKTVLICMNYDYEEEIFIWAGQLN